MILILGQLVSHNSTWKTPQYNTAQLWNITEQS